MINVPFFIYPTIHHYLPQEIDVKLWKDNCSYVSLTGRHARLYLSNVINMKIHVWCSRLKVLKQQKLQSRERQNSKRIIVKNHIELDQIELYRKETQPSRTEIFAGQGIRYIVDQALAQFHQRSGFQSERGTCLLRTKIA